MMWHMCTHEFVGWIWNFSDTDVIETRIELLSEFEPMELTLNNLKASASNDKQIERMQ